MPPREPFVPKTHHHPIPSLSSVLNAPSVRPPSPPSRGSTRRLPSRRDSGPKDSTERTSRPQPPRTTTTRPAWRPATPPSRQTPPPPPDEAEGRERPARVEARDRTPPNAFVRVSPRWKINSRRSAPRGSAPRTRWRSVRRDPRDSARPTSKPSRSSRPGRASAVVYSRRHHNGPSHPRVRCVPARRLASRRVASSRSVSSRRRPSRPVPSPARASGSRVRRVSRSRPGRVGADDGSANPRRDAVHHPTRGGRLRVFLLVVRA